MVCWYCDRDESQADAPLVLVAQRGEEVLACVDCGKD